MFYLKKNLSKIFFISDFFIDTLAFADTIPIECCVRIYFAFCNFFIVSDSEYLVFCYYVLTPMAVKNIDIVHQHLIVFDCAAK